MTRQPAPRNRSIKAFHDWVFEEVGRFKKLFDRACEVGSAASADLAANALHVAP